jgi:type IV fimbrial biogenesis protein FimT
MKSRHSGFTLFELLVALAMVGILVGLAAPSFRDFGTNTRVVTTHNDLVGAFAYARSEAIRRNSPVTVCSSSATATDRYEKCATTGWGNGWLVFTDRIGINQGQVNGPDQILQIWRGPSNTNVVMEATGTGAHWLTFTQSGLVNPSSITKSFTVHSALCPSGAVQKRQITVNPVGSVRTHKVACP